MYVVSHFGSRRRTGVLACAGPSRPHTCDSGPPGHGGWGGQRSPLWATATGPGLFRSLGFKNPSGYWLFGGQHTAIQRVGRLGGAEAPACVVGVFACVVVPCAKFQCLSEGGRSSGSGGGGGGAPMPINYSNSGLSRLPSLRRQGRGGGRRFRTSYRMHQPLLRRGEQDSSTRCVRGDVHAGHRMGHIRAPGGACGTPPTK